MEKTLLIVGIIIAVLIALAYVYQVFHLVTKKCTACMNMPTWSLWAMISIAILGYSFLTSEISFQIIASVNAVAIVAALIVAMCFRSRACPVHKKLVTKIHKHEKHT